eukprot:TRINITY_DN22334_c0_g1_i3.p1 TRINITY_DN22334_c0_g1~~TRINITY_DN22334_c0_g1_i3.p1  ORF type:complete len:168 (+),score=20.82 TRINITY_DN22334_c0_g1_i3:389-892(+)
MHIYPLYEYLPNAIYYTIYATCCACVILFSSLTLILYCNRKSRWNVNWITVLLAHFTTLATTSGLVPLLGTLLTVYSCEEGVLKYQPEATCGSYVHVLFIVIGTLSILFLVPYVLLSGLLYFEATWLETNSTARRATSITAFEQALKVALLALSIACLLYTSPSPRD